MLNLKKLTPSGERTSEEDLQWESAEKSHKRDVTGGWRRVRPRRIIRPKYQLFSALESMTKAKAEKGAGARFRSRRQDLSNIATSLERWQRRSGTVFVGGRCRECRSVFHINADCEPHFYPRRVGISIPSHFVGPDAVENNSRWNARRRGDDEIIAISFIFAASEFMLPADCSFMKWKKNSETDKICARWTNPNRARYMNANVFLKRCEIKNFANKTLYYKDHRNLRILSIWIEI